VQSVDGTNVATYDFGGSGPLLVFCHATGFCAGVWEPLASLLATNFHCIGLDFRAHGQSKRQASVPLAWTGMAADLLAVIADAKNRRGDSAENPVYAVGHSMGGAAMVLAELAKPGTISKGWAFEPILFPEIPDRIAATGNGTIHEAAIVKGARRRRAHFTSRDEAFHRYAARPPLNGIDPQCLRAYVNYGFADLADGSVELRCKPEDEAQVFENSLCGAFDRLAEIKFPLLVAASGDKNPPAEIAPQVVSANSQFQLAQYPDLTHFGPLQQATAIGNDIALWFGTEGEYEPGPSGHAESLRTD